MSAAGIAGWVLAVGVLVAVGLPLVQSLLRAERKARWRSRLLARGRARVGERAAIDAAIDDPVFSPERIRASVSVMLELAGQAREPWSPELSSRADEDVIRAWAANRGRSLAAAVRPVGLPAVDILRVVNREGETEDRVVARVRFQVLLYPRWPAMPLRGQNPLGTAQLDEQWTLARCGEDWRLVSVVGDPLARPVRSATLITSPSQDIDRIAEQSLRELASNGPVGGMDPGELVDAYAPPQQKLLDLSLVDDRFAPSLIAAALQHIVEAWEAASDDSRSPPSAIATSGAWASLLCQAGDRRRVVRDATLRNWHLLGVYAGARPPKVCVSTTVNATVYFSEAGCVVGSATKRHDLRLVWTLELDNDKDGAPRWRLAESAEG